MPRSRTSAVPRESHHYDSSVWASVTLTTSPTAFMLLTMLAASGICVSPVAYGVLCVRFASLVRICSSRNHLQRSAGHATLDTGGWLDLMETVLCLPVRDFHPERNDKLRLPHIKVEQPVTQLPPHKSRRAEFPHRAFQYCSLRILRHTTQKG